MSETDNQGYPEADANPAVDPVLATDDGVAADTVNDEPENDGSVDGEATINPDVSPNASTVPAGRMETVDYQDGSSYTGPAPLPRVNHADSPAVDRAGDSFNAPTDINDQPHVVLAGQIEQAIANAPNDIKADYYALCAWIKKHL